MKGVGHDKAVDWWSLGTLLYEMLAGRPPFYSKNRKEMFNLILEKKPEWPMHFSEEAKSLLSRLLEPLVSA